MWGGLSPTGRHLLNMFPFFHLKKSIVNKDEWSTSVPDKVLHFG